jgi:nucleotide-binding universal stress UspA family protein
MIKKILIATHGTEGAVEAELHALDLARRMDAELHALYVIHKGWGTLVGIEWLHSSERRMEFYRYTEAELYKMADAALSKFVHRAAACGVKVTTSIRVNKLEEAIVSEARAQGSDLIVLGNVGKERSEEYRAKVSLGKLMKFAPCSVLRVKAVDRDSMLTHETSAFRLQGALP